ncbi:hypothetical protein L7F22_063635 [Adiantum nelumboides]|nr:hypothetical protein [Adiantum nelumboides]
MQHGGGAAYRVAFAWEEKPGVPKKLQQSTCKSYTSTATDVLVGLDGAPPISAAAAAATSAPAARPHPAVVSFSLCKPPRLQGQQQQHHNTSHIQRPPLGKTASFSCATPSAPRQPGHNLISSSKRFVRRVSSFDHTIHGGRSGISSSSSDSTFKLNYITNIAQATISSRRGSSRAYRIEDDPFSMAILACRKDPRALKAFHYSTIDEVCTWDWSTASELQLLQAEARGPSKARRRCSTTALGGGLHISRKQPLELDSQQLSQRQRKRLPLEEEDDDLQGPQGEAQQQQPAYKHFFACFSSCFSHL